MLRVCVLYWAAMCLLRVVCGVLVVCSWSCVVRRLQFAACCLLFDDRCLLLFDVV